MKKKQPSVKIHFIDNEGDKKAVCGRESAGHESTYESKINCKLCKRVLKKRISDAEQEAKETVLGRPLVFKTTEALQKAVDDYFNGLITKDEKGKVISTVTATVAGLALALDIETRTLVNYEKKEKFFPIIRRAKQRIEVVNEIALHKPGSSGAAFNLKVNFGWVDVNRVDHTSSDGSMTPGKEALTEEEIKAELEKRGLPLSVFKEK